MWHNWITKVLPGIVVAGPMAVAGCRSAEPAPTVPIRTVTFDNVYGTDRLLTHVTVDSGPEQWLTATCDPKTCTFKLPLTNARHELAISVEQGRRRSAPTRVTVDTSQLP